MSGGWWTLTYRTAKGQRVACHNLQREGANDIERAQRALGSYLFQRTPQPHHYVQFELDLLNAEATCSS